MQLQHHMHCNCNTRAEPKMNARAHGTPTPRPRPTDTGVYNWPVLLRSSFCVDSIRTCCTLTLNACLAHGRVRAHNNGTAVTITTATPHRAQTWKSSSTAARTRTSSRRSKSCCAISPSSRASTPCSSTSGRRQVTMLACQLAHVMRAARPPWPPQHGFW